MLKKTILLVVIVLLFIFSACSKITYTEVLRKNMDGKSEYSSLTDFQKLMLEDYEYMWNMLRKNYPLWGVIKRRGIDADKVYEIYKKQINTVENEIDFYNLIDNTIKSFFRIGHLELLNYNRFKYTQFAINKMSDDNKYDIHNDILYSKKIEEAYEKLRIVKNENKIEYEYYDLSLGDARFNNVKYYDLVENEVAYIDIKSFSNVHINDDYITLENIYKKIKDYKHVVFDISHNKGGESTYYLDNIVKPNIGENKLRYDSYILMQKEKYNEKFLNIAGYQFDNLKSVSELPYFENINKDDFEFAPYFFCANDIVYSDAKEKALNGRIWVIISGDSYSAADAFAYFCKETGFATLLGQTTGGNGFGISMGLFKLPNSHYVVMYSPSIGLNSDGSNNIEIGTKPDYYITGDNKNIKFINDCLKVIQNNK